MNTSKETENNKIRIITNNKIWQAWKVNVRKQEQSEILNLLQGLMISSKMLIPAWS